MLPRLISDNSAHMGFADMKFSAKVYLSGLSRMVTLANDLYRFLAEFCRAYLFTLCLTVTLDHLGRIFSVASLAQVCWVYAKHYIARMLNQIQRPNALGNKECKSMGRNFTFPILSTQKQLTVFIVDGFIGPSPAITVRSKAGCFIDLAVKSLNVLAGKNRRVYIGKSHLNFLSGLVRIAGLLEAFQRFAFIITHVAFDLPLKESEV